jgi:8-oxo-dGTP pyrophosphatase MutT (NUDIX family)
MAYRALARQVGGRCWRVALRSAFCGLAGSAVAAGLSLDAAARMQAPAVQAPAAADRAMQAPAACPLAHVRDHYSGVIVEPAALAGLDAAQFGEALSIACAQWAEQSIRGVWLHVPIESSGCVPVAVAQGFAFHHTDSKILTLVRWLPSDLGHPKPVPNTLPPGPSHQIGVGAFVVHNGCVLMVKERSGPAAKYGIWKVPTGLVDPGEDLFDAVQREVLEETGCRTTSEGARLLSMRFAPRARPAAPAAKSRALPAEQEVGGARARIMPSAAPGTLTRCVQAASAMCSSWSSFLSRTWLGLLPSQSKKAR